MRLTAQYSPCKDGIEIRVFIPGQTQMEMGRLPSHAEYNRRGGISLDYDGAWSGDETIDLPPECLATQFLRLAFMCAFTENSCP